MVTSLLSMLLNSVFIIGCVKSAISRSDLFSQTLTSKTEEWGSWSDWVYCDEQQYANTIKFRSDEDLGDYGDDVAGVAVQLICQRPGSDTEYQYNVLPTQDGKEWGTWHDMNDGKTPPGRACELGEWLIGFRTHVEDKCDTFLCVDDETALNCIQMNCTDGTVLTPNDCRLFGTWGNWDGCDQGYICGFRDKFLADGTRVDEKGLTGVEFKCCDFHTSNPSYQPSLSPSDVTVSPTRDPTVSPVFTTLDPDRVEGNEQGNGKENGKKIMNMDSKTVWTIVWIGLGTLCCCIVIGCPLAALRSGKNKERRESIPRDEEKEDREL